MLSKPPHRIESQSAAPVLVLQEGHPSTPHHGEGEEDPPHRGGEEEDHGVDPLVVGGLVGEGVEVVNTVLTSTQMACCWP